MSEPASPSYHPVSQNVFARAVFFLLAGLLLLSAGYDWEKHIHVRTFLGIIFIVLAASRETREFFQSFLRLPALFFFLFVLFEVLRAVFGFYHRWSGDGLNSYMIRAFTVNSSAWVFYFLLFVASFRFVRSQSTARGLLLVTIAVSAFLAFNTIPPLAIRHTFGYLTPSGATRLLHPFFYSFPALYQYLFPLWSNMNWVGDFLSFGVFAGFGLGFYELYRLTHASQYQVEKLESWSFMTLVLTLALVGSAGIFLLLSRGTILFFLLTLIFYFAFIFTRVSFRYKGVLVVLVLIGVPLFLNWAGNGRVAVKEIESIQGEIKKETRKSFSVNLEGGGRALRIFRKNPVLGIGKGNYAKASDDFSSFGEENKRAVLAETQCMSHYLKVMAEEGSGAFLYFLFLVSWAFAAVSGLFKTQSRLQLCLSLSLTAPVLLVLGHAAINDLMDRFSMPALVYISMGAALGVLSREFQRD